jgi:hypothetical protein
MPAARLSLMSISRRMPTGLDFLRVHKKNTLLPSQQPEKVSTTRRKPQVTRPSVAGAAIIFARGEESTSRLSRYRLHT